MGRSRVLADLLMTVHITDSAGTVQGPFKASGSVRWPMHDKPTALWHSTAVCQPEALQHRPRQLCAANLQEATMHKVFGQGAGRPFVDVLLPGEHYRRACSSGAPCNSMVQSLRAVGVCAVRAGACTKVGA